MQKLHLKVYQIMRPLAKVWCDIQSFMQDDEKANPDPEEMVRLLNATVVLLGQTVNKIAYERRLSVLTALSDMKNAKRQLRENVDVINKEESHLFGDEFQKKLKTITLSPRLGRKVIREAQETTIQSVLSVWLLQ